MAILRKWNYEKHIYEPYEIPDDWNLVLYTDDMDEPTTCSMQGMRISVYYLKE